MQLELLAAARQRTARETERFAAGNQRHRGRIAEQPLDLGEEVRLVDPVGVAIEDLLGRGVITPTVKNYLKHRLGL